MRIIETRPGNFSLLLDAGTTKVDALVAELGHEPNGYFWEGVARLLVAAQAPGLDERFGYDPEGDMFCAYGEDREALVELEKLLSPLTTDAERMRTLVTAADAEGYEFDD